jgi:hypothetical protein
LTYPPSYPPPGPSPYPAPAPPAIERVRAAYLRRNESDYIFDFWTAFGWTVLTCGVYGIYIVYQLVRRSRDHNLRRFELLDAANAVAWERANAQGLADDLRPNFERVAGHLDGLRRLSHEFRDPSIWTVLGVISYLVGAFTVVEIVAFVLLDGDLVKHDYDEGGAENELAYIYGRLGLTVDAPDPGRLHHPHNYVGRILASVFTCGIYTLWWMYDVMEDGNRHFTENWAWEDSLARALQS